MFFAGFLLAYEGLYNNGGGYAKETGLFVVSE